MDRVAYLDFVAVPILFVLIYDAFIRKMTKGPSNRLFLGLLGISVLTTVSEAVTAVLCTNPPISDAAVVVV